MDDKLNEKNYLNNDILIESKNIKNNSKYITNSSNNKRKINLKFNPKLSDISQKGKYSNHSLTERKYKIQEYKENIINNGNIEDKKFIRLKKGMLFRIKNKTLRNNNNNINKEEIHYKNNPNREKNFEDNLFRKEIGRKSEILTHSYSYDYLNLNSDVGFKFKLPFENSKMLCKNFVKGMKNQERKLDLINAIEKYNKYKTLFSSKSERQLQSKNNLDNNNYNEYEKESVEKRKEQINRIQIQNIINFRNVYESIKNRKDMKDKPRKTDYNQEKNHKEVFVRKILREEKYTIEDDGQEKILEINQAYLPNKVNITSFNNFIDTEKEKKIVSIKDKENFRQIPITNENIINANNENNNALLQKRRSYQNFNKNLNQDINEFKNKIFIKKHPTNLKINDSSKLNKKKFINQRSINKNKNSNYIIFDNHNRNHSYREVKNLTENNVGQKYFNNSNYTNFDKNQETKNKIQRNKNICMTNYIYNNPKIDIKTNKYKLYTNKICSSKEYTNNNFIHEIINKDNKNGPKQFIMFNLNNFNNSNKNQNNNVITIYTSPNYK